MPRPLRIAARLLGRILAAFALLLAALVLLAHLLPLFGEPPLPSSALLPDGGRLVTVAATHEGGAGGGTGATPTIETAVVEAGPPDGPPVVLVHGFGGSTFSWRLTLPDLAAAGYRVVALDLANFGLATKRWELDASHPAQARHVLAVMDALGIGRAVVVGHSMGGSVVTHLALAAPERVAGLVLVDAAVVPAGIGRGTGGELVAAALRIDPLRRLARQVVRLVVDDDRLTGILASAYADPAFVTPDVADGYLAQIRTADWDLALMAVIRDQGRNALPAPLGTVATPTLVVWGAVDPWIPLARGEALAAAIPGARLVAIPGAGHLPFEEDPVAFAAALAPFLEATAR
ncbi:MAG: hypothetical protein RL338_23 [Chloroflexota bacterium]